MVYRRADGSYSEYPTDRNAARTMGKLKYDSGKKCTTCISSSVRYVYNEHCVWCSKVQALDRYNKAISNKGRTPSLTVDEARAVSDPYYITVTPCKKAGHIGKRLTNGGGCFICENEDRELTPRKLALLRGDKWYKPKYACKHCGEKALKRVDNGICLGCRALSVDGRSTAESTLMREYPDLIFTREFAKENGVAVYRTGKLCVRRHRGYKYTSTGTCIQCLRGVT